MEEKSHEAAKFRRVVRAVQTLAKVDRIGFGTCLLFMIVCAVATDYLALFVWIGRGKSDPLTITAAVVVAAVSLYLSWIGADRRSVKTQGAEGYALLVMIVATVALTGTVIMSAGSSGVAIAATVAVAVMTVFHAALTLAKTPAVVATSRVEDALWAQYTGAGEGELLLKIGETWRRTGIKGSESRNLYSVLDLHDRDRNFPPNPVILMDFRMRFLRQWVGLQIAFQLERTHFSAAGLVVATQCASLRELEASLQVLLNNRVETHLGHELPLNQLSDWHQAAWLSDALHLPWVPARYPYYQVTQAWIESMGSRLLDHPMVKQK